MSLIKERIMRYTWTNQGSQPEKIKPFLQALGMGHRLISDIKHGQGQFLINGQTVAPTALVPSGAQLTIIVNPEPVDPAVQVNHQPYYSGVRGRALAGGR
jgi:23S rRNA pseudouridine1911/1915/1917 synthase